MPGEADPEMRQSEMHLGQLVVVEGSSMLHADGMNYDSVSQQQLPDVSQYESAHTY